MVVFIEADPKLKQKLMRVLGAIFLFLFINHILWRRLEGIFKSYWEIHMCQLAEKRRFILPAYFFEVQNVKRFRWNS